MISPVEIAGLRARLKVSQSLFADDLGVSRQTVSNWETGREMPSGPAEKLLRGLLAGNPVDARRHDDLSEDARGLRSFFLSLPHLEPSVASRDEDGFPVGQKQANGKRETFTVRALAGLAQRELISSDMLPTETPVGPYMGAEAPLSIASPLALLGVRYIEVPRLNDQHTLPVITADPMTYYLDESENVTLADPGMASENVVLSTIATATKISRRLIKQTAAFAAVEATLAAAQLRAVTRAVARDALTGDGTGGAPTGLINFPGLGNTGRRGRGRGPGPQHRRGDLHGGRAECRPGDPGASRGQLGPLWCRCVAGPRQGAAQYANHVRQRQSHA